MRHPRLLSFLLALQVATAQAAWCVPTSSAVSLDAIRAATGIPPLAAAPLWLRGRVLIGSLVMPWALCVDASGRFVERTSGPLGDAFGYDGRQAWVVDSSGMPRTAGPGETESTRLVAWVLGGYWLARTCPLRAEPAGKDSLGEILELACPGDRRRSRITVDPTTHLPLLLDRGGAEGWETVRLEDYREDGRGVWPHRLVRTEASLRTTILVDSVRVGVAADTAQFYRPSEEPADLTFDLTAPSDVAVRRQPGRRHLLVRPKINGADVGWFVLDSGATVMCLAKDVADSLGLPVLGRAVASGWSGPAETAFRQGRTFELGPLRIEDTKYLEIPASFGLDSSSVRIAGIVGYDLFRRAVIEIDVKTPQVRILPTGAEVPAAAWQRLRLDGGLPSVQCALAGGREEWFAIDTGAPQPVILLPWLAEELGLAAAAETPQKSGDRQVDLRNFSVAGRSYPRRYALVPSRPGIQEDCWLGGALGRRLLLDFRLVFDYRHERVAMIRHSSR
jgi:hypothetical protein